MRGWIAAIVQTEASQRLAGRSFGVSGMPFSGKLKAPIPPLVTSFAVGTVGAEDIEWPAYGGAAGGGHFSAADEITRDNVDRLELS